MEGGQYQESRKSSLWESSEVGWSWSVWGNERWLKRSEGEGGSEM